MEQEVVSMVWTAVVAALALSGLRLTAPEAAGPGCPVVAPSEDASTWTDRLRGRAAVETPGPPRQGPVEVHIEARGPTGAHIRAEVAGRLVADVLITAEDAEAGPGLAERQDVLLIGGGAGLRVAGQDADGRPLDVALDVSLRSCGEEP